MIIQHTISAIMATFGNALQIIMETNRWIKTHKVMKKNSKINSLMIISLALADLLVGVTLIIHEHRVIYFYHSYI